MKPLMDIWANALNNEDAFTSDQRTNEKKISALNVRLTKSERIDLYEILARDTVNDMKLRLAN